MIKVGCTVFVDASYCHETKIGSFHSVSITGAAKPLRCGYVFEERLTNNTEAEAMAIIKAIEHLQGKRIKGPYHIISDCLGAMHLLQTDGPWYQSLIKVSGRFKISFGKVKAHNDSDTSSRYKHHKECDLRARSLLRQKKRRLALDGVEPLIFRIRQ